MDKEKNNQEQENKINEEPASNERLSRTAINTVYGDEYDKIKVSIKEMEEKTKKYFKDIENHLGEKFREFNLNLENNFVKLNDKFSKAFGLDEESVDQEKVKLIQGKTKKYLDQLKKIKNMHEQILESIKIEMSILINSLDISKSLEKEKPIQKFLEKEFTNVINSWLFIKLDFENFNLIKTINNSNLDDDFKDFIYKVCQNKNFVMNIGPTKKNDESLNAFDYEEIQYQDSTMITENYKNITKMNVNKIRDADSPFELIDDFPKLRYLKFNNCSFSYERSKYSLIRKCSALEKLIINGAYNFEAKMLENFSKNLTRLTLSNNNFVNSDFENIMKNYIVKSDSLRMNLELLSFSNNSLSKIDLESIVFSPKHKFSSLKELDFHKNRITKFTIMTDLFLELKCINCCYNKFSKSDFAANDKILALLSGNLFLTNINKCKEYYTQLQKQLNDRNQSLTHLTISYLPNEFGKEYLEKIIISDNILINLRKLDLSYNNLSCDILFSFIQNNMGCIYLKDLNLAGNKIDDSFFERYLEFNYQTIFTKLKKLNLSDNLLGDDKIKISTNDLGNEPKIKNDRVQDVYKLRLIYKFIEKNKNLSKLYLTKNPMSEKSVISTDLDMNAISSLMQRDEKSKNIIIDSFYSFLKKIMDELLMNKKEKNNRGQFNIKFDIDTHINLNSENFKYKEQYILFN